jgi:hypothetical protein
MKKKTVTVVTENTTVLDQIQETHQILTLPTIGDPVRENQLKAMATIRKRLPSRHRDEQTGRWKKAKTICACGKFNVCRAGKEVKL